MAIGESFLVPWPPDVGAATNWQHEKYWDRRQMQHRVAALMSNQQRARWNRVRAIPHRYTMRSMLEGIRVWRIR